MHRRRIDALDGRDLRRWHDAWSAPLQEGGKPRIAAARMAIIVLKNALGFAATCRKPGCAELMIWPSRPVMPNKRTTARVYDRDRLEAARRVAQARSLIAATQRVNGVSRNASRPKAKINGLKWFHIYRALTLRIA